MNISTIEHGEELLKASTPRPWEYIDLHVFGGCKPKDTDFVLFLVYHASELLQIAREVERLKVELAETLEALKTANALLADYTE